MPNENAQIQYGLKKVSELLEFIRPDNDWTIIYDVPERVPMTEWDKQYFQLIYGDNYFFIFVDGKLLYAVNVTGDSVLTAISELVNKLAAKF